MVLKRLHVLIFRREIRITSGFPLERFYEQQERQKCFQAFLQFFSGNFYGFMMNTKSLDYLFGYVTDTD